MNNMPEWEEIKPWEEAPRAEDRSYDCGKEQAQCMEEHLGPELNRKLEIMAAKLAVLDRCKERVNHDIEWLTAKNIGNWHGAYLSALICIMQVFDALEREIKAELI